MRGQASVSAKQESQDRGVTTADLASGTTRSMVVKVQCLTFNFMFADNTHVKS